MKTTIIMAWLAGFALGCSGSRTTRDDDGSSNTPSASGASVTTGGGVDGCVDYSQLSGSRAFAADVMPIFQQSCNLSNACHSSAVPTPAGEGLQLGPPSRTVPDQAALDAVHARIVNGESVRSTSPLVMPGDPTRSWLMQKLEYGGDLPFDACPAVDCADTPKGCGNQEPNLSPQLAQDQRDTIAIWIKAGAPNN